MGTIAGTTVFHIVGTILSILSLIFVIIALSADYWVAQELEFPGATVKIRLGLWRTCTETSSVTDCESLKDSAIFKEEDWVKAWQAFIILSMICFLAAVVCAIIRWFVMKENSIIGYLACALSLVGGVFVMIGWAVFLGQIEDTNAVLSEAKENLHFCFGFAVVATITGIVAFVFFLLDVMQGGSVGQSSE